MITQKILVVDDEETVCNSITKVLSRKGYRVSHALTVENALTILKETAFDLVITDLMMPGTNGLELLQILRDHYPELDVIMITGYASIESAVKATRLGAAAYLPKPFTPDELAKAAESALSGRTAERAAQPHSHVSDTDDDIIDVDMPFSVSEVARATSDRYVESLTHTDIPVRKRSQTKPSAERVSANAGSWSWKERNVQANVRS